MGGQVVNRDSESVPKMHLFWSVGQCDWGICYSLEEATDFGFGLQRECNKIHVGCLEAISLHNASSTDILPIFELSQQYPDQTPSYLEEGSGQSVFMVGWEDRNHHSHHSWERTDFIQKLKQREMEAKRLMESERTVSWAKETWNDSFEEKLWWGAENDHSRGFGILRHPRKTGCLEGQTHLDQDDDPLRIVTGTEQVLGCQQMPSTADVLTPGHNTQEHWNSRTTMTMIKMAKTKHQWKGRARHTVLSWQKIRGLPLVKRGMWKYHEQCNPKRIHMSRRLMDQFPLRL
jgi:hypothetical protein